MPGKQPQSGYHSHHAQKIEPLAVQPRLPSMELFHLAATHSQLDFAIRVQPCCPHVLSSLSHPPALAHLPTLHSRICLWSVLMHLSPEHPAPTHQAYSLSLLVFQPPKLPALHCCPSVLLSLSYSPLHPPSPLAPSLPSCTSSFVFFFAVRQSPEFPAPPHRPRYFLPARHAAHPALLCRPQGRLPALPGRPHSRQQRPSGPCCLHDQSAASREEAAAPAGKLTV